MSAPVGTQALSDGGVFEVIEAKPVVEVLLRVSLPRLLTYSLVLIHAAMRRIERDVLVSPAVEVAVHVEVKDRSARILVPPHLPGVQIGQTDIRRRLYSVVGVIVIAIVAGVTVPMDGRVDLPARL